MVAKIFNWISKEIIQMFFNPDLNKIGYAIILTKGWFVQNKIILNRTVCTEENLTCVLHLCGLVMFTELLELKIIIAFQIQVIEKTSYHGLNNLFGMIFIRITFESNIPFIVTNGENKYKNDIL